MDTQDFVGFAFMALVMCFPFSSIYLVLKLLRWNPQGRLFSDSWFVYLSWLFSSFLVALLTNAFQHFPIAMIILIFANTLTIALTLWGISNLRKKEDISNNIFGREDKEIVIENKQKIWKTSFLVSISAVLTVLAIFTIIIFAENLIERINPKPKTSFGIYEI